MKTIIPDKVSPLAAEVLSEKGFDVTHKKGIDIEECNKLSEDADSIIVRSYKLHDLAISSTLKAIGRAGAGVNNIPIDKCSENGVVVFNTPGANANAVKELVLCGLLLSSRKIVEGIHWTSTLNGEENVSSTVEKNKGSYKGNEIKGKTLGVIGLGAIGMLIANDASNLGMNVIGYDPYISVSNAWQISHHVKKAEELSEIFSQADYITLHVPLLDATKEMINTESISTMKKGVKILNFSRGELVNNADLLSGLSSGAISRYVTDFASDDLIGKENVLVIPHLGASTSEAEENCAQMVCEQIADFLLNGNITNSVNFPTVQLPRSGSSRIVAINKNTPGMVEKITNEITLNIECMINKSKKDVAVTIIDTSEDVPSAILEKIQTLDGVIKVWKV